MRILHIFHNIGLSNGVDQTTLTLMTELQDMGVHVFAVVRGESAVTRVLSDRGTPWRVMPLSCCSGPAWRAQLRYLADTKDRYKQLRDLLLKERFDAIHLNTGHLLDAALAAASTGVPVIWHIHGPFEVDYQRYAQFLTPEGYAWILQSLGSQVIAVSGDTRQTLIRYLPPERVHLVNNGIDIVDLDRRAHEENSDIRRELGLPPSSRLVLGVGRIAPEKDFLTFARVAERVAAQEPTAYFAIAGGHQDRQLVKALNAQILDSGLKGRMFILGERDDVPSLMKQGDVLLSTSLYEGHPLVVLESMTLGLPVVGMACGGLAGCIQNGVDGLLVPPGDIEGAADAVIHVLRDQIMMERICAAGRQKVAAQYAKRNYAEQFLNVARLAIEFGPSRTEPGAVELICGLLGELNRAKNYIQRMERNWGGGSKFRALLNRGLEMLRNTKEG